MTPTEHAVLEAAAQWAITLEARCKADEEVSGQAEADDVFSDAEVDLYAAVLKWRGHSRSNTR